MTTSTGLDDRSLDIIFGAARTHNNWREEEVPEALIRRTYELARMGPTSMNCSPARFLFLMSKDAKAKLAPALLPGNLEKTLAAPCTVLIGYDTNFHERLPELFPHLPQAAGMYAANPALAEETAFRNSSLQGAYLIIAARSLGLDCGPMSGFNAAAASAAFWPDGRIKANFLCNLAYGDGEKLFPRGPRLSFDDACQVL